jgi:hypothetical protein
MNASILTMLVAPYLLFGCVAGLIYRAVRRQRRLQSGGPADLPTHSGSPAGTRSDTGTPPHP